MYTRSLAALAALLATTMVLADDVWKWTDENGVVQYSDVPVDGAKQISLSEYTRTTGARISRNVAPAANDDATSAQAPFHYDSIVISTPAAEETLWNIEGVLKVNVTVSPGLQRTDRIRAYFDGEPRMVEGASFQIDEVYRGVHNLQVEIIDNTGKLMIRSQPNRFYVQQNVVKH